MSVSLGAHKRSAGDMAGLRYSLWLLFTPLNCSSTRDGSVRTVKSLQAESIENGMHCDKLTQKSTNQKPWDAWGESKANPSGVGSTAKCQIGTRLSKHFVVLDSLVLRCGGLGIQVRIRQTRTVRKRRCIHAWHRQALPSWCMLRKVPARSNSRPIVPFYFPSCWHPHKQFPQQTSQADSAPKSSGLWNKQAQLVSGTDHRISHSHKLVSIRHHLPEFPCNLSWVVARTQLSIRLLLSNLVQCL